MATTSSLLVAGMDLNMVQMLRQATQPSDSGTTAAAGGSGNTLQCASPAQAAHAAVLRSSGIAQGSTPSASISPDRPLEWHPRLNAMQLDSVDAPVPPCDPKQGIQPPWRMLPWPTQPAVATCKPRTTVIVLDATSVGRTLDMFI